MSTGLITDKILLEFFKSKIDIVGFHPILQKKITKWFTFLESLDIYKLDKSNQFGPSEDSENFTLFEFATISQKEKKKKAVSKSFNDEYAIYTTGDLWKSILQGAIEILKRYDLRENPSYHNKIKNSTFTYADDLPDITDLASYYERATDFEKILYGSDPWYRDHFAHVIRVWLLGFYVIHKFENKILIPSLPEYKSGALDFFSQEELFASFTIAALTHDLGYPLEKLKKLNKKISEILDSFGGINWSQINASMTFSRHESALNLLKLMSSKVAFRNPDLQGVYRDANTQLQAFIVSRQDFKTYYDYKNDNDTKSNNFRILLRCQWKYFEKFNDSLENNEHGFLSALLLQRKLIFFKEGEFALEEDYPFCIEEARQFLIRREILRSITTHTCEGIYFTNTLALDSLLFFVDEIQEWGRPFFSDLYGGTIKKLQQKVFLNTYKNEEINWAVDAGSISMDQAIYWLVTVSRKYSIRFRAAPEEEIRKFKCVWTLKWENEGSNYDGIFNFEDKKVEIKIVKKGTVPSTAILETINQKLDSGIYSNVDDIVDAISNSEEIKKLKE